MLNHTMTEKRNQLPLMPSLALLFSVLMLFAPRIALADWTQTSCPAGGNILSFAVSGSNLFAGANSNYVYVTTDNGSTWEQSSVGLPTNASINAMVVYGSRLYAGVYGNGIYVTTDGYNWYDSTITGMPATATVMAFLANNSKLFAGTYGNGMYVSTNNGTSWTAANTGLSSTLTVNGLATNGASIFIASASGIYRSNDNGVTWTLVNGTVNANTILANGSYVYAGTNGTGMYYSSDNGATWTAFNNGLSSNANILSLAANGTDIFAGTADGVYHSCGISWMAVNSGLSSIGNTLPITVAGSYLFAGTGSGVWKSILPPLSPSSFVPANNATNQPDSLTFSWNALSTATSYSFVLSTDSTFSSSITHNAGGLTTNSVPLKGLTNSMVYFWRVNATNIGGTSAWCAANKFTTTLLSPTPSQPVDQAVNQPISLAFSWNAVSTATSYALQIGTDSSFITSIIYSKTNLSSTSQTVDSLSNNKLYYWRVSATNSGGTGAWSKASRFTTIVAKPSQPILGLPANKVVGQAVSLSLSWNAVSSASSYSLLVSTDSTFTNSIIYSQSSLTATSQMISGLSNSTTYYWRVCATNMSGTSPWSTVNCFSTILATPTLSLPASGSANQSISPTLSWNAVTSATSYAIQLATDQDFSAIYFSQTGLTSLSQTVSALSNNTTYYWRVNATNSGGTSAWSSKYSLTTIAATPVSPTLVSPLNQAMNQAISLTLTWSASTSAMSYSLQVSTDSTFASSIVSNLTGLSSSSQTVTGLANNTRYFWRVCAANAAGVSPWSAGYSFATILAAPSTPALTFPANGATNQPINLSFSWNPVDNAATYTLQVSTDPAFATTLYSQSGITAQTQTVSGFANGTVYYWRVNASNTGGTGAWATKYQFTTSVALAGAPNLLSPVNNATNQPLSLTASWSAVSGAISYACQVSTDSTFTSTFAINQSGLTVTSLTINGLTDNTVYFWRVNTTNAAGVSAWSTVSHFSTLLPTPILETPTVNATGQPLTILFKWDSVATAQSYWLRVSTDSSYKTSIFNQSGLTATSQTVTGLANNTPYYWCVCATNDKGTGSWSAKRRFTTVLAAPVLSSPANNAANQLVTVKMVWLAATTATSYTLQISTDSSFAGSLVYTQSGLTAVSQSVTGLVNNTVYYWHVSASNASGTSEWSDAKSFTTSIAAPTPSVPSNNAVNQPVALTIAWTTVPSAISYGLQVSTDTTFTVATSFVYKQSGLTSTSQAITGLVNSKKYCWRVNALSTNGGTSEWSPKVYFTTVCSAPVTVSPAKGAINQSVSPKLSWSATSMTSYTLQISLDSTFSTSVVYSLSGIATTSQIVSGLSFATTYYWRVYGVTATGGMSEWSNTSSFSTTNSAPTPITPVSTVSQTVTFLWDSVPGSISYTLQVATDSTFATKILFNQSNIATTSETVTNLASGTVYFWRVNATNISNGTGTWSTISRFTTISAAPTLLAPVNKATDKAITDTLTWSAVAVATSYSVQLSPDSNFTNAMMFTGSKNFQIVTGLANSTAYFWRVNATDAGGTSAWSPIYHFTTIIGPPATPKLSSTSNNPNALSIILSWDAVADASSYTIQIATDSAFAKLIYNQNGIVATSQTVTGLASNLTYYWRVSATNGGGTSAWSPLTFFKVQAAGVRAVAKQGLPSAYALDGMKYNPFTSCLTVAFAVPPALHEGARVIIKAYTMRGRQIAVIMDTRLTAGYYQAEYNRRNNSAFLLSSGRYLFTMEAPGYRGASQLSIVK